MSDGLTVTLAGRHRDRCSAPPAVECAFGAKPVRITDFDEQGRGGDDADSDFLGERGAGGLDQFRQPALELLNAVGQDGDVVAELVQQAQVRRDRRRRVRRLDGKDGVEPRRH